LLACRGTLKHKQVLLKLIREGADPTIVSQDGRNIFKMAQNISPDGSLVAAIKGTRVLSVTRLLCMCRVARIYYRNGRWIDNWVGLAIGLDCVLFDVHTEAQQEWEAKREEKQAKKAAQLEQEEKERSEREAAARAKAEEQARIAWENAPIALDEIQSLRSAVKGEVQLYSILKLVNIDEIIDATLLIVAACANGYNIEQLSTGLKQSVTAVKGLFAAIPQFISLFTEKPKQQIVASATTLQNCTKGLLASIQV
jgi:hypothetical protein